MSKAMTILCWTARVGAALILLQTLFFKFSGADESVYIFSTVGMEPYGRIAVGIMELLAAVLLMINRTAWMGSTLSIGLMAGALFMHLTVLGIEVKGDGGYLFFLAAVVLVLSLVVFILNRKNAVAFLKSLRNA